MVRHKVEPAPDLLKGLNRVQLQAVRHGTGPALVIAGPGTGKTTVITRRIAQLILSGQAQPEEILALTFTDRAAREMEERVDQLLPYGYVDTQIMTFHALGSLVIQNHILEAGLKPGTKLASPLQQHILLQEALEGLDSLQHLRPVHNPGQFAESLLSYISRLKDEGLNAGAYSKTIDELEKEYQGIREKSDGAAHEVDWELYREVGLVYARYEQIKLERGYIDFGDQLLIPFELLSTKPALAQHYQMLYKYLLVDEFQDTNYIQAQLMYLLSEKHRNLMAVGDDDQSIYRFRGAELQNILDFSAHHPEAKQYVLKHNYRSTQRIIDVAYDLIQHNNPERLETRLGISKHLKGQLKGKLPRLLQADSLAAEIHIVVDLVEKALEKQVPEEIAILCRNNQQAGHLIAALQQRHIAVATPPVQTLLRQPIVRQCVDFIRVLHDPADSPALYRYLISPKLGVEVATVIELTAAARHSNQGLADYILALADQTPSYQAVLGLQVYRRLAQDQTPGEILYKFVTDDGYLDRIVAKAETSPEAARDVRSLARFFELVAELEAVESIADSHALWRHVQTMYELEVLAEPDETEAVEGVQVLTVHRAKGLEFTTVFTFDLTEGSFPAGRRGETLVLPQQLLAPAESLSQAHFAEERRLCYVALTRARRSLTITFSTDHGGKRVRKPSRFLFEAFGPDLQPVLESGPRMPASIQRFSRRVRSRSNPLLLPSIPQPDGWLELTPNQIADYLSDPGMFYLRHVLKFPTRPHHRLTYGTAIHAALEAYFRQRQAGERPPVSVMLTALQDNWQHQGFASPRHEQERRAAAEATLRRLHREWSTTEFKIKAVETPFSYEIAELKLRLRGRYDLVLETEVGAEIRDFKTSSVTSERTGLDRVRDSIQLQLYALAWEELQHDLVGAVSLDFVETGILAVRKKIDHQKTLEKLRQVTEGIRAGQYPLKGYYMDLEAPKELL